MLRRNRHRHRHFAVEGMGTEGLSTDPKGSSGDSGKCDNDAKVVGGNSNSVFSCPRVHRMRIVAELALRHETSLKSYASKAESRVTAGSWRWTKQQHLQRQLDAPSCASSYRPAHE